MADENPIEQRPARIVLRVLIPSDKPEHDEQLFECVACGHDETLIVKMR